MRLNLKRINLLDESFIWRMQNSAFRILEEYGIEVRNEEIIKRIKGKKGLKIVGDRVHLEKKYIEKLIEDYLKGVKNIKEASENEKIIIYTCSHSMYYLPFSEDKIVPFTTENLIFSTKLIDSLFEKGVRGTTPGIPTDIHPDLQPLLQFKIGAEYCRNKPTHVGYGSSDIAEYLKEMYDVMGYDFVVGFHMISPLKMAGNELEIALNFIDRKDVSFSVSSMPMAGVSAPFSLIGTYVQAIAEILGGFAIMKSIDEGLKVYLGAISGYVFDMKYATMVYGTPEHNLSEILRKEISEFYGMKFSTRSLRTMAKIPGIQSCVEKSSSAVFGLFLGSNEFNGAGSLCLDEIFSPEQLIIDCEIRDYVERLKKGIEFEEEDIEGEIISEGLEKGDFLTLDDTIKKYRNNYWFPSLFDYELSSKWFSNPLKIKEKINEIIKTSINSYNFCLEKEKKKELDKIWERALKSRNYKAP